MSVPFIFLFPALPKSTDAASIPPTVFSFFKLSIPLVCFELYSDLHVHLSFPPAHQRAPNPLSNPKKQKRESGQDGREADPNGSSKNPPPPQTPTPNTPSPPKLHNHTAPFTHPPAPRRRPCRPCCASGCPCTCGRQYWHWHPRQSISPPTKPHMQAHPHTYNNNSPSPAPGPVPAPAPAPRAAGGAGGGPLLVARALLLHLARALVEVPAEGAVGLLGCVWVLRWGV